VRESVRQKVEGYLTQDGVTLHTNKNFVINAFILYKVFNDLLDDGIWKLFR